MQETHLHKCEQPPTASYHPCTVKQIHFIRAILKYVIKNMFHIFNTDQKCK